MRNSPAEGKLSPEEVVLMVNGQDVTHVNHLQVAQMIKTAGRQLILTIDRYYS